MKKINEVIAEFVENYGGYITGAAIVSSGVALGVWSVHTGYTLGVAQNVTVEIVKAAVDAAAPTV